MQVSERAAGPDTERVTVITPHVTGRAGMLTELGDALDAQTYGRARWLIGTDTDREGPARIRNALLWRVRTPWVALVDDDDLVDPDHLETLLEAAQVDPWCPVVFTRGRLEDGELLPFAGPPAGQWRRSILASNTIPQTALVATAYWRAAGGQDEGHRLEDWSLWRRIAQQWPRPHSPFRHVPTVTWTYRQTHPHRRSVGRL